MIKCEHFTCWSCGEELANVTSLTTQVRESFFSELLYAQEESRGQWLVNYNGEEYEAYMRGDDNNLKVELVNADRTLEFEIVLTLKKG